MTKNLFDMEKKYYFATLYFGEDSSKVFISLDQIDELLRRGYVIELINSVRFFVLD